MRALTPTAGHIICVDGSHILLLRRSHSVDSWPGFWAFPGGKVEDDELLREGAIRETAEEVGIWLSTDDVRQDIIVNARYMNGTRIYYFGVIQTWQGVPDNIEPEKHDELRWFALNDLPKMLAPHHQIALECYLEGKSFAQYDTKDRV